MNKHQYKSIDLSDKDKSLIKISILKGEKPVYIEVKIARFVKKLIDLSKNDNFKIDPMSDSEIELLNNRWKSFNEDIKFEIKKGYDIIEAYKSTNSPIVSCMTDKHDELLLYVMNEDNCSLIKFTQDDKMIGRVITWVGDDGKLYNDRLYSTCEYYRTKINEILEKEGYINLYKTNNKTSVTLKRTSKMPYLDSLKYSKLLDDDKISIYN